MSKVTDQPSIVDDFMYGSNVAAAHVSIRLGFLRKVYGIVTAQLLTTVIIGVYMSTSEDFSFWIAKNSWFLMLSFIGIFGTMVALMVKRQETPTNYILLAVFTILESFTVGTVVTMYNVFSVIEAFALTMGVTVALTVYTLQSKRDFSSWGAGLFACLWVLLLVMIMQILVPQEFMDRVISAGAAILFSLFIVFDTHMMMHKLSPEEYIMAAVNLYLDILNLFLHILRIVGERKN